MMMHRRTILIGAVVALVLAIGISIAYRLGAEHGARSGASAGQEALERLQLIWPRLSQMPDNDRLILAYLAMRCDLHDEPAVPRDIVRCLSRAATAEDSSLSISGSAKRRAALARLLPSQYAEIVADPQ